MLRRFFISFLGTMAGIWLSVIIGGLLFLVIIVAVAFSESKQPAIVEKGSVLHIPLAGEVLDRYKSGVLIDQIYGTAPEIVPLNALISAIDKAASDDNIDGIFLDCKGATIGMADMKAIADAIEEFKESGKWVYAYADNYTQGNYVLASAVSDSLYVNPVGMIDIHGLSVTTMYFKNMLEKVGVEVQVVKVGTFKSAVEPYILTGMSDANRLQQEQFLGSMWDTVAKMVAVGRNVDTTAVNKWADSYSYTLDADEYVKAKMADKQLYRQQFEDFLAEATGKDEVSLVDFSEYVSQKEVSLSGKGAKIAVLYAVGDITEAGDDGIASERIVPEIVKLTENDKIDGLVLRVNSPGGSAFASEQIWAALKEFKEKTGKPFYVSMGNYAASGGYYISCGADKIYAEPLTLTGSIGIFGMIPNAQNLLNNKLGINVEGVETNKGQFPTIFSPMSTEQAAAMQGYVNRGYELFVKRCADGRHTSVDSIKAVAEGRVWDGKTAKSIGLVDELGGLKDALEDMAALINEGTSEDGYTVTEYPKIKVEWWDEVMKLQSQLEDMAVAKQLGVALPYYRTLNRMMKMNTLQCRMDFVEVK